MSSCLKERKTSRLGGEMIGMYILDTGSCSGETEVDGYDMGVNDDGLCSCIERSALATCMHHQVFFFSAVSFGRNMQMRMIRIHDGNGTDRRRLQYI